MSGTLLAIEGSPIALTALDIAHLRSLLGGLSDQRGDEVTISRVVGHIRLPSGNTLRIRSPKAPSASILAWAAYADPRLAALRVATGHVPVGGDDGDIASLLARLLVWHTEDAILRHGLLRQYQRSHTNTETLRGRIDFARLTRQGANLARVPCEIWERSEGTVLNRFVAAALRVCARDPMLSAASDPGLSRVRTRMAAITPQVDRALLNGTRALDRSEQPFALVVALARMILSAAGLLEGDDHRGAGFLVNLETLFERTVVRALRENGVDVVAKSSLHYERLDGDSPVPGSAFEMDAYCRGLPDGDLIVDAKYKRSISSANLHQMIAYAAITGARRAAFVVPAGMVADRRGYRVATADGGEMEIRVLELRTDATTLATWRDNARLLCSTITPNDPHEPRAQSQAHTT